MFVIVLPGKRDWEVKTAVGCSDVMSNSKY